MTESQNKALLFNFSQKNFTEKIVFVVRKDESFSDQTLQAESFL